MLVISDRISHLDGIGKFLKESEIPFDKLYDKYDDIKKNHILLASLSKSKEGLDLDYLNTIIFCTPPKGKLPGLKQVVGRILRKNGKNDDEEKIIVDF